MIKKANYFNFFFLCLIFLLGFFLRFYRVSSTPPGLYVDEAAIGYNSYSILQTGKDEYGKTLPIFFKSFDDYKMPLYIYFSTLPIKFFGLSVFSVRLISIIAGSLSILLIYFLVKSFYPQKSSLFGLLASFLLAICPQAIFLSRMALEPSLALFLLLLALFLQVQSFKKRILFLLILSTIFYGLSAYAYHAERFLVLPLYIATTVFLFLKYGFERKKIIISLLILVIICLPQIILFNSTAGKARIESLSVAKNKSLMQLPRTYLSLYTAYFSPRNLFFDPDSDLQRSLPELSVFYSWMFVPFLIGVYQLFSKKKEIGEKLIILLFFISPMPASLAGDPFSSFRAYPFIFPLIIIISLGIEKIYFVLRNKTLFFCLGFIITFFSLVACYRSLFVLLPKERFLSWSYGYQELVNKLADFPDKEILIDDPIGTAYIEMLFFQHYPPVDFQKTRTFSLADYYQTKSWDNISSWGRYSVRTIEWKKDVYTDQLIVARPIAISDSQAKEHFLVKSFVIIGPDEKPIFNGFLTQPEFKKADNEKKLREKNESGSY